MRTIWIGIVAVGLYNAGLQLWLKLNEDRIGGYSLPTLLLLRKLLVAGQWSYVIGLFLCLIVFVHYVFGLFDALFH